MVAVPTLAEEDAKRPSRLAKRAELSLGSSRRSSGSVSVASIRS
jgi:hypothetical protein